MQYYLYAYVEDCRMAEKYHEVSILFNNLKEAESYYNQFNGKEIFDEEISTLSGPAFVSTEYLTPAPSQFEAL